VRGNRPLREGKVGRLSLRHGFGEGLHSPEEIAVFRQILENSSKLLAGCTEGLPATQQSKQTMRALIIDDSRTMRMIVGRIIRELGFEITEAGDGQEALKRLVEFGTPDIILVDWNMPVMNGFEFVKAVRANPLYESAYIIMVTTETELGQITRALEAGANEYVMKPFTKEVIRDKLLILGVA
jgi:two-component system chemotaxis response regulator CheY